MSRVTHQAGAYPGFRSMKRLGIYITTYIYGQTCIKHSKTEMRFTIREEYSQADIFSLNLEEK